jgi:hypothetical protein
MEIKRHTVRRKREKNGNEKDRETDRRRERKKDIDECNYDLAKTLNERYDFYSHHTSGL